MPNSDAKDSVNQGKRNFTPTPILYLIINIKLTHRVCFGGVFSNRKSVARVRFLGSDNKGPRPESRR